MVRKPNVDIRGLATNYLVKKLGDRRRKTEEAGKSLLILYLSALIYLVAKKHIVRKPIVVKRSVVTSHQLFVQKAGRPKTEDGRGGKIIVNPNS